MASALTERRYKCPTRFLDSFYAKGANQGLGLAQSEAPGGPFAPWFPWTARASGSATQEKIPVWLEENEHDAWPPPKKCS
jgi:hypothetical protein